MTNDFAYCDRCYHSVVCRPCTVLKRQKISTRFFLHTTAPDRVKIWLTSVNPFLPILFQSAPPPVDLSVEVIRRQIAAEWLEIAKWSQRRAYRKPPSLCRMAPPLITYDLPFPKYTHTNDVAFCQIILDQA